MKLEREDKVKGNVRYCKVGQVKTMQNAARKDKKARSDRVRQWEWWWWW